MGFVQMFAVMIMVLTAAVQWGFAAPSARQYSSPPNLQEVYDNQPPKLKKTPFKGMYEWVFPFYAKWVGRLILQT